MSSEATSGRIEHKRENPFSAAAQQALSFGQDLCVAFFDTGTKLYAIHSTGYNVSAFLSGRLQVADQISALGVVALPDTVSDMQAVAQQAGIRTASWGESRQMVAIDAEMDIVTYPL